MPVAAAQWIDSGAIPTQCLHRPREQGPVLLGVTFYWQSLLALRFLPIMQVGMSLASGSIAGLVSSTATFPLDLIRRRMQLQGQGGRQVQYTSYSHAVKTVIQREGFTGLYHGILPEYYKVVPGVAIAFCTYEVMKSMLGVQTNVINR